MMPVAGGRMQGVRVSNMSRVPVAEGLLAGLDEHPRLIASRRRDTGVLSFPAEPATDEVEAILLALKDAGISWDQVQRGYAGSLEVSNPDAVVGKLGLTGIPFFGVFNGCATANTAVTLAAEAIEHGVADIAIAVGFDKHPR